MELAEVFPAMSKAREDASYRDLATAAAILIDKLQLLEGQPTERVETVERMLNDLPEDEYTAVIAEAERIIAEGSRTDPGNSPAEAD